MFDALLCWNWLFSPPNCLSLRISLLCTRPWINGPSSIYALPGWKYNLTLSLGLHQKVLTLFFVQTLLQVTARKRPVMRTIWCLQARNSSQVQTIWYSYLCLESNQSQHECNGSTSRSHFGTRSFQEFVQFWLYKVLGDLLAYFV